MHLCGYNVMRDIYDRRGRGERRDEEFLTLFECTKHNINRRMPDVCRIFSAMKDVEQVITRTGKICTEKSKY